MWRAARSAHSFAKCANEWGTPAESGPSGAEALDCLPANAALKGRSSTVAPASELASSFTLASAFKLSRAARCSTVAIYPDEPSRGLVVFGP
jgi:hypothetical protein